MTRTCPECDGAMTAELLRPDPHDSPVYMLICPCGYSEAAPADIEADAENRPPMKLSAPALEADAEEFKKFKADLDEQGSLSLEEVKAKYGV